MAGVEVVVGLAIGVVPLLVSAIEHYDDVLRPFVTYRKFTSKAQRFHDGLEMERTIFRTECHLLLAAVADRGLAAEMLNDPHHPSWKDIAVCERFGRQLGSLGTTFASLLSKMVSSLEGLSEKSQEFNAVIAQPKEVSCPDES